MGLFVPPRVARELELKRVGEEIRLARLTSTGGVMADFNRDLKAIDPYLQLVKAHDTIEAGTPLKPAYWHIIRHNPGAPPSVMVIEGPDGEYVEPTSRIFDLLKAGDLQNPATTRRLRERNQAIEDAKQRREAREREDRNTEAIERYKAATRTQVSMASAPWSQNVAGRKGARG